MDGLLKDPEDVVNAVDFCVSELGLIFEDNGGKPHLSGASAELAPFNCSSNCLFTSMTSSSRDKH